MASYHLSVKTGGKGSASPHADYISREGKYAREKDSDLEHKESGNMPAWAAHKPSEFWKAADTSERANGCTYREIEIALPRELKPEQRLELVRDFVRQEIGDRHAYQFAIHNPKAAIAGGEQPHAHIMFSERMNDGIDRDPQQYFKRANSKAPECGGAKKARFGETPTERKEHLVAQRER
uniref:MobA/MobL family protein n=2 Tax=Enterobacterales TaxID=91347 RepID=UPI0037545C70